MRRRRIDVTAGVLAAATAALSIVTGCGTDPAGPAERPERADPAPAARADGPVRALTQAEQARVDRAEERLVQRCMREEGFRYWVAPRLSDDVRTAFDYRFVRDDIAWAREHGYGERFHRAVRAAREDNRNLSYREGLPPDDRDRYATALGGGPDTPVYSVRLPAGGSVRDLNGGCQRLAREQLYGDAEAFFRADKVATNLTAVYSPRLTGDPRFRAGVTAWSGCMRAATGRSYAEPNDVRADVRERTRTLGAAQAHTLEIDLAVAEATCARQTGLSGTLARLDAEYGDPVRKRYAEQIAARDRMNLTALARADTIVEDG